MNGQLLEFRYDAKVISEAESIELSGSVLKSNWRTDYTKTPPQAAWAFVRGLLEVEGEWYCSVLFPDGEFEKKTIDVSLDDGVMFRMDRER